MKKDMFGGIALVCFFFAFVVLAIMSSIGCGSIRGTSIYRYDPMYCCEVVTVSDYKNTWIKCEEYPELNIHLHNCRKLAPENPLSVLQDQVLDVS